MAQVDFSNAVLQPISGARPLDVSYQMGLNNASPLYNQNTAIITTNHQKKELVSNPSHKTLLFTGVFTASGTVFIINNNSNAKWMVSNVSFNVGDTYSFAIDVDINII